MFSQGHNVYRKNSTNVIPKGLVSLSATLNDRMNLKNKTEDMERHRKKRRVKKGDSRKDERKGKNPERMGNWQWHKSNDIGRKAK